ncbi:MAG: ABC transporter permease [Treponema sp.]|nr:ABC transporter permease [Treponema sp.]
MLEKLRRAVAGLAERIGKAGRRKSAASGAPSGDTLSGRFLEVFTGSDGLVSVAVVVLGFLVATLILVAIGRNPGGMYEAIVQVVTGFDIRPGRGAWDAFLGMWRDIPQVFRDFLDVFRRGEYQTWDAFLAFLQRAFAPRAGWSPRHVGEWLLTSTPLILCGLSMAFAARTGLFNIGAEGQYIVGLTAAQIIALSFPPVPVLHLVVSVGGAVLAGAAWGGVVGFFKARYRVSEVVATIMMNYIALFFHRIVTLRLPGALPHRTPDFPETATLASPFLASLTGGSRLNYGLWLTLMAIVAYWLIMRKTRLGYSLRATGLNRDAAHYGGINVKASITAAMAIAGGFAGLAGGVVSLGVFSFGRVLTGFEGFGFEGIAVALVGNSTAWGVALAGLLFGMLRSAQPIMQMRMIPREITSIIVGMVVIFISLRAGLRLLIDWRMKEQARGKRDAVGESGAKGDAP